MNWFLNLLHSSQCNWKRNQKGKGTDNTPYREVWLPTVQWSQQTACLPKQFERGLEQLSLCKIGWHAMLLADLHMQTSFPSFPFLTLRSILVGILKRGRSTAFSANLHTVEIFEVSIKKRGGFRGYTFIQCLSPNLGWIQPKIKRDRKHHM